MLLLGLRRRDDGISSGSAYIFERDSNGNWSETQKLTTSDPEVYAYFGSSVAISGNYAIVGAYLNNNDSGSVYIFERDSNGNWGNNGNETQKLTAR